MISTNSEVRDAESHQRQLVDRSDFFLLVATTTGNFFGTWMCMFESAKEDLNKPPTAGDGIHRI